MLYSIKLEQIPNELLDNIISYLPQQQRIDTIPFISKSFLDAHLYRLKNGRYTLKIPNNTTSNYLKYCSRLQLCGNTINYNLLNYKNVSFLSLTYLRTNITIPSHIITLKLNQCNIPCLKFEHNSSIKQIDFTKTTIKNDIELNKNIEYIRLNETTINFLNYNYVRLKELYLSNIKGNNIGKWIQHATSRCVDYMKCTFINNVIFNCKRFYVSDSSNNTFSKDDTFNNSNDKFNKNDTFNKDSIFNKNDTFNKDNTSCLSINFHTKQITNDDIDLVSHYNDIEEVKLYCQMKNISNKILTIPFENIKEFSMNFKMIPNTNRLDDTTYMNENKWKLNIMSNKLTKLHVFNCDICKLCSDKLEILHCIHSTIHNLSYPDIRLIQMKNSLVYNTNRLNNVCFDNLSVFCSDNVKYDYNNVKINIKNIQYVYLSDNKYLPRLVVSRDDTVKFDNDEKHNVDVCTKHSMNDKLNVDICTLENDVTSDSTNVCNENNSNYKEYYNELVIKNKNIENKSEMNYCDNDVSNENFNSNDKEDKTISINTQNDKKDKTNDNFIVIDIKNSNYIRDNIDINFNQYSTIRLKQFELSVQDLLRLKYVEDLHLYTNTYKPEYYDALNQFTRLKKIKLTLKNGDVNDDIIFKNCPSLVSISVDYDSNYSNRKPFIRYNPNKSISEICDGCTIC